MDEEILKRSTDCVYFLASPFTCKKGADCEYRHSDMARLNPRDCWYWLSGNCLNPTCAFRHPPLEIQTEVSSEAAVCPKVPVSSNVSSAPVSKTTVLCFFYFNGFCNKGDTCPFLHEPSETYSWKPKMVNTIVDVPVPRPETKISGRTDVGMAPVKTHPAPEMPITSHNSLEVKPKEVVQKSTSRNTVELKSSSQSDVSNHEEIVAIQRVSLEPDEGSSKSDSEPSFGSEHSSEELADGNNVRDEWWESSPGFDVLVDGKSEDMAYEDDLEHDEDRESLFVEQGYVDQIDYRERSFIEYDPHERVDGEGRYPPRRTLDRKVGHALSHTHKRKFFSTELPAGAHDNVDLRDYLRKRRMGVDRQDDYLTTRALAHDFGRVRDERERLDMHAPNRRVHRPITSKAERNVGGFSKRTASAPTTLPRNNPRNLQYSGARRRVPLSSEAQRRSSLKTEKSPKVYSGSFAGPKSLAEIKGRKREGLPTKNSSVDFEGPKPLCEILKDKNKTSFS